MRRSLSRSLRGVVAALLLAPALAAAVDIPLQAGDETDEERFVRLTAAIEDEPLADNIRAVRTWLLEWAINTPDLQVNVCTRLGPELSTANGPAAPSPAFDATQTADAPGYAAQLIFGNAAFQIAHPERRGDLVAIHVAALESVLRLYDTRLGADPSARVPYLDELTAAHAAGTFAERMKPIIVANCIEHAPAAPAPSAD